MVNLVLFSLKNRPLEERGKAFRVFLRKERIKFPFHSNILFPLLPEMIPITPRINARSAVQPRVVANAVLLKESLGFFISPSGLQIHVLSHGPYGLRLHLLDEGVVLFTCERLPFHPLSPSGQDNGYEHDDQHGEVSYDSLLREWLWSGP